MEVKYQIFISSTYIDLKDERDQAIKAVLEMGHFPVGMEMFSAGDEEQWKYIAKRIDESDYYVVIVAHRYGSLAGKISFTEKEYDYADKQGIPILGFIIDGSAKWPADKMDKESSQVLALNDFKKKIKKRAHKLWKSSDDLFGQVGISLGNQIKQKPRIGWIRTPQIQTSLPSGAPVHTTRDITISAATRVNRILKLDEGLTERETSGEVYFDDENNQAVEIQLPTKEGLFELYFNYPDDKLESIDEYLYIATLTDSFNKAELLANIRILLHSIISIYKYEPEAYCSFIIATNEDLSSQKGSVLESFEKMKAIATHPNPDTTTLEIWDNQGLHEIEAELGIVVD